MKNKTRAQKGKSSAPPTPESVLALDQTKNEVESTGDGLAEKAGLIETEQEHLNRPEAQNGAEDPNNASHGIPSYRE